MSSPTAWHVGCISLKRSASSRVTTEDTTDSVPHDSDGPSLAITLVFAHMLLSQNAQRQQHLDDDKCMFFLTGVSGSRLSSSREIVM